MDFFEIIDNTKKSEEQELVEDLIQIVTVFSCRLQGKRANKAKKRLRSYWKMILAKKIRLYIQRTKLIIKCVKSAMINT